jgi:hypothetical protein
MKTLKTLAVAAVATAALAAASTASAAAFVTISASVNNGPLTLLPDFDPALTNALTFGNLGGGWTFNTISGAITGSNPFFAANSLNITTTTEVPLDLDIFIAATYLDAPTGIRKFETDLTANALASGWSVMETTWLSPINFPNSGIPLGTYTFGPGPNGTQVFNSVVNTGPGPYAITTELKIHTNGVGNSDNLTVDVFDRGAAVPEPATWAMMILGLGGMGGLMRSQRRRTVAATA